VAFVSFQTRLQALKAKNDLQVQTCMCKFMHRFMLNDNFHFAITEIFALRVCMYIFKCVQARVHNILCEGLSSVEVSVW